MKARTAALLRNLLSVTDLKKAVEVCKGRTRHLVKVLQAILLRRMGVCCTDAKAWRVTRRIAQRPKRRRLEIQPFEDCSTEQVMRRKNTEATKDLKRRLEENERSVGGLWKNSRHITPGKYVKKQCSATMTTGR